MPHLFKIQDITFGYHKDRHVLKGVNLVLSPGERLCLTGCNGAGKSTLLKLMVGLLTPISGKVIAFGKERETEKDFYDVRRLAGFVFQDPDDQLFCPTVEEDIAFGPYNLGKSRKETNEIVDHVLNQLKLQDFKNRITHKLSGGEKRLVTLAAVLAMEPEVLLLDEPTNALDEGAVQRVTEILLSLPQAMIIVSHDARFRDAIGTRSVYLHEGETVSCSVQSFNKNP